MDVFSTQSLESAKFILSLFSNLGDSANRKHNLSALKSSQAIIKRSLKVGSPAESGYLFSTLVVRNATAPSGEDWPKDYSRRAGSSGGDGGEDGGEGDEGGEEPDVEPDVEPDEEPDDDPFSGSGYTPVTPPLNNVPGGSGALPTSVSASGGVTSSKKTPLM